MINEQDLKSSAPILERTNGYLNDNNDSLSPILLPIPTNTFDEHLDQIEWDEGVKRDKLPQCTRIAELLRDQLKIPHSFELDSALPGPDNLFDAIARAINYQTDTDNLTIKSLRKDCEQAVKLPQTWLVNALRNYRRDKIINQVTYFAYIANTSADSTDNTPVIAGIPEIEGRFILAQRHLPMCLHFIEIKSENNGHLEIIEKLITANSEKVIENPDNEIYSKPNIIHLVKYKNHIVPFINRLPRVEKEPELTQSVKARTLSSAKIEPQKIVPVTPPRSAIEPIVVSKHVQCLRELYDKEIRFHKEIGQFSNLEVSKVPREAIKPWWIQLKEFLIAPNIEVSDKEPGGWARLKKIILSHKIVENAETLKPMDTQVAAIQSIYMIGHFFTQLEIIKLNPGQYGFSADAVAQLNEINEENFSIWINAIYALLTDEILSKQFKEIQLPSMIKVADELDNNVELKNLYAELCQGLGEIKLAGYNENYLFFNGQPRLYFEGALREVSFRIAQYEATILSLKDLIKKLIIEHPAQYQDEYQKLIEMHQILVNLNKQEYKKLQDESARTPGKKRLQRKHNRDQESTDHEYSPKNYLMLAKLQALIACIKHTEIGKKIIAQQDEQQKKTFEQVSHLITDTESLTKLERLIHRLFIGSKDPNYKENSIPEQLVEEIETILINYKPETSGIYQYLQHFKLIYPLLDQNNFVVTEEQVEQFVKGSAQLNFNMPILKSLIGIFNNSYLNIEGVCEYKNERHHFIENYNTLEAAQSVRGKTNISPVAQQLRKKAKHFIRINMINQVKSYFEQLNITIKASFLNHMSEPLQQANQLICNSLTALSQSTPEALEKKCRNKNNEEKIKEAIIDTISQHIMVAGIIPNAFLTGLFGKTVGQVKNYFNSIVHEHYKVKSLSDILVPNNLPRYVNDSKLDERPAEQRKLSLIANLLILCDFYLHSWLGLKIAERAGVRPYQKSRHRKQIIKLRRLVEKMALDSRPDSQAQEIIDELLVGATKILSEIPITHDSRAANELRYIIDFCSKFTANLPERNYKERFPNAQRIFNYKMSAIDAAKYIQLHMTQGYAQEFMSYIDERYNRVWVDTAICKDKISQRIIDVLNNIYQMSLDELNYNINQLPPGRRNISFLIQKMIDDSITETLPRSSLSKQGALGKMLDKIKKHTQLFSTKKSNIPVVADINPRVFYIDALEHRYPKLTLLAARLLALVNAYGNTEFATAEKFPINNGDQGQNHHAVELAYFAVQMFLESQDDSEQKLIQKMQEKITQIRGENNLIFGSSNSRFAKGLEELIDPNKIAKNRHHQYLPMDAQNCIAKFPQNQLDYAKNFIQRYILAESCKHFVDLENEIINSTYRKAGVMQLETANSIINEYKNLSRMTPVELEATIIRKLGKERNIRDLIIDKMSNLISKSGQIAACYFENPFKQKLYNTCNFLNRIVNQEKRIYHVDTLLLTNQVVRFPMVNACNSLSNIASLQLPAVLMMLSDYYLNTPLGRRVAERGAQLAGQTVIYNDKQGWRHYAFEVLEIASRLSLTQFNSDKDLLEAMVKALNQINRIIKDIREGGWFKSGYHSRFANELIKIISHFGSMQNINVKCQHEMSPAYLFQYAAHMFNYNLDATNAKDYIDMHLIENVAKTFTQTKTQFNKQRWNSLDEKHTLNTIESNMHTLFIASPEERENMMSQLPKNERNIRHLIKRKMSDNLRYSIWTEEAVSINGQLQKPIDEVNRYLFPEQHRENKMRIC